MPSAIRQIPLDTATQHHSHDFHQIVIGLKGQAELEIKGLGGWISSLSGCIVPANHVHYYAGKGENQQLILDLPLEAPSLPSFQHELSCLFDAPRFFTLDWPLVVPAHRAPGRRPVARITCYALQQKECARSIQQPLEATHHHCHSASIGLEGCFPLNALRNKNSPTGGKH